MFFGAQPGLDGVKSVLSICFFEDQHGVSKCESHPNPKTYAQHGVAKSVLSMFTVYTPGSIVNELNTDLSEREFTFANPAIPWFHPCHQSERAWRGSAAQVWLAHFGDTRNEVAAKVVSKKGLDTDQIGWIHKRLRHP